MDAVKIVCVVLIPCVVFPRPSCGHGLNDPWVIVGVCRPCRAWLLPWCNRESERTKGTDGGLRLGGCSFGCSCTSRGFRCR